jgi:hypothetical protein
MLYYTLRNIYNEQIYSPRRLFPSLYHSLYTKAKAPRRAAKTPPFTVTTAAALAVCSAGVDDAGVEELVVAASEPPVVVAAGAVVGSATPDGQCQWSPCGSQVVPEPVVS